VKPGALARKLGEVRALARANPEVMATSAEAGLGIAELRAEVAGLAT
jgi:hypothetical protein